MTNAVLRQNFFLNARGLTIADGGGVTWTFNASTNTLSVSSISGTGIAADSVSNTELSNMAQATIKGRASGAGTGDPTDLTAAQVKTILSLTSADLSDFTEAAQDATGSLLQASADISPSYNDSGNALTLSIINGAVTYAKIQNVSATNRVLGRITAGAGTTEELTGANLATIIGTSLGANPSASVGLSAVSGSAGTYLRSDAAPALSQSIAPTWTGIHTFGNAETFFSNSGAVIYVGGTTTNVVPYITSDGTNLFFGTTNTGRIKIQSDGYVVLLGGLTNAANDAAAATAGVPVNALYRNGSAVMIRVT